ncbi:CubicO group peptidase, beta-lactamase class C family [Agromyces sp. CF514]|uniref:serine hydrolase domain-containing protein n=1 Tax=Agromyces sp. CF514 TaxID=1881031 RepID=UPI0008E7E14A|nr:serine hydrolase domain-containing protein [Agromyces sp. CF514]SFR68305.1 CubicO group peptidase, beta-lactamase class C family [Agromyces sp. CF514]
MPARQVSSRGARRVSPLLAGMIAVSLVGCAPGGSPPDAVDTPTATESALEQSVRDSFTNDYEQAAVAVIEDGEVSTVFVRSEPATAFEIGSITKSLTGELLAIAIDRGEVGLDDPLGAYLPLGDAPAASVTLESLATHRSGLPLEPTDAAWVAQAKAANEAGTSPYTASLAELIDLARVEPVVPSDDLVYSNLGVALLGHALAAAAGTDYRTLLEDRILVPLGMEGAVLAETPEQVPEQHADGHRGAGEPVDPWWGEGFGPAANVHATLDDLVALAIAVLDGPLEDSAALEPLAPTRTSDTSIGYLWWIGESPARTITGNGGVTDGFRSGLMIDRDAGIASIVLANSPRDVDELTLRFLVDADVHD